LAIKEATLREGVVTKTETIRAIPQLVSSIDTD
jgi:hypothetical protein